MKATWLVSALIVLLLASYIAVTHKYSVVPEISCPLTIYMHNCSHCNASELFCSHLKVRTSFRAVHVICNDAIGDLPNLNIGNISTGKLLVENCMPSEDEPLLESLSFLGVNSTKNLAYKNLKKTIPYTAVFFKGLQDLEYLSLKINFEQVKLDVFKNLTRLQTLDIYNGNPILLFGILNSLVELSTLAIYSNDIIKLQSGIFRNQRKLKKLVLKHKMLHGLNQNTFDGIQNLEFLDLSSNSIDYLPKNTFSSLPNLTELDLSMNKLPSIPVNLTMIRKLKTFTLNSNEVRLTLWNYSLSHHPELKNVELSSNNLYSLPETLFHGSKAIVKVDLSKNDLQNVPELLLRDLGNLEYLNLSSNYLSRIPEQFFTASKKLKHLSLSYNEFESITGNVFAPLRKLKELHLNNNRLYYIDYGILQGTTSLEQLFLQHNRLKNVPDWKNHSSSIDSTNSVNTSSQFGKMSLENLNLSNNEIEKFSTYHFNFYSKAVWVDLSNNQIETIYINNTNKMTQATVSLANNRLKCDFHLLDFIQYVMTKNKSHIYFIDHNLYCWSPLYLHGINFDELLHQNKIYSEPNIECPPKCDCGIRPMKHTIVVNCSGQGLTNVQSLPQPSAMNYTFIELHIENNFIREVPTLNVSNYEYVRELHARNNSIELVSVHNLPTHLNLLDLTHNKLTTMDQTILDTFINREALKSVYLSNNPWTCECTNQDLIRFVQQNRLKLSADKSPIICEDGTLVDSINVDKLCGENTRQIILISLTSAFSGLLIGLLFALYYYYKTEIKVWLFTHNLLLCLVTEEELDKDKDYDAFVSYCHKDAQFIEDVLVPRLEHEMNFKICVHERDWIPGEMIPDQIISSVENSRRTIVVLSKHYLESTWAQMEFQIAYLKSQAERRVRIIIIIVGEIEDVHSLGPELEAYLKMNTYVKYDDRWFWDKLRYAMPHPVAAAEV